MKNIWLALLSVCLLPGAAYGQMATIQGRIIEAATERSVYAINVVAHSLEAEAENVRYGTSTDANGRFRIEGLPAGAYVVKVTGIGYIPAERRVELDPGETASLVMRIQASPIQLSEIVVEGKRPGETAPATVRHLPAVEIARQDPATVADVARLIPAAHVHTNSRGQTILYFRNSVDRQTAQFFEGALLNIPWDNRVDLGMLPAAMLEDLTASTGVPSVRYGANVIAGAVNFHPRVLDEPGELTQLNAALGTQDERRVSILHLRRKGNVSFTAALDYTAHDDVALADNSFPVAESVYSQRNSETRTNTDRWIASGFLRGAYQFDDGSRLSMSVLHVDAEHGIAPESNLDPENPDAGVRYWRYPTWRKSMLIVSGATRVNGGTLLRGAAWFNRFEQNIQQFGSVAYDTIDRAQENTDYTGGFRLIAELPAGPGALALSANALTTRHWQNIIGYVDGAAGPDSISVYRQHILGVGAEYDMAVTGRLTLGAGAGFNSSIMAETGDYPERDPFWAWEVTTGLTYDLSEQFMLTAAAGRKTRFPTMRELYGGALGKFLVNPELGAVSSRMVEAGIERLGTNLSGSATLFLDKTDGTIAQRTVQISPDTTKEQRINLGGSRTYGIDLVAAATLTDRLRLDGQLTWMNTRAIEKGEEVKRNEKPAWLGQLTALYDLPLGLAAMAQVEYLGGAYARIRTVETTFISLPAATIIDARLSYEFGSAGEGSTGNQLFLRVNNLMDDVLLLQLGLPGPGREFLAGVKLTL